MKALDETMNAKSLFGRRLRVLLAEKNMNQRELAEVLGVTESTVGKWTLSKSMPRTIGTIQTIADYFHVNKNHLLDEKADKNGLISVSLSADTSRNMCPSYYDDPEVAIIAAENNFRAIIEELIDRIEVDDKNVATAISYVQWCDWGQPFHALTFTDVFSRSALAG